MNVPALIWSVVALTGLILSLYLGREAARDVAALRRALDIDGQPFVPWVLSELWQRIRRRQTQGNGRLTIGLIWLAQEAIRVVVHGGFLFIGAVSINRPSTFSVAVAILIVGNVGMIVNSLLAVKARHLLYDTRDNEPPIPKPDGDA